VYEERAWFYSFFGWVSARRGLVIGWNIHTIASVFAQRATPDKPVFSQKLNWAGPTSFKIGKPTGNYVRSTHGKYTKGF
jgi:hypothetical protein